jgi:hypothetical protein
VLRRARSRSASATERSSRSTARQRRYVAEAGSQAEIAAGRLEFRTVAIEDFALYTGEDRFDLAFAMRVGALDGRHLDLGGMALSRLQAAVKPHGLLCIDDRPPVRGDEIEAIYQRSMRLPVQKPH